MVVALVVAVLPVLGVRGLVVVVRPGARVLAGRAVRFGSDAAVRLAAAPFLNMKQYLFKTQKFL